MTIEQFKIFGRRYELLRPPVDLAPTVAADLVPQSHRTWNDSYARTASQLWDVIILHVKDAELLRDSVSRSIVCRSEK